VGARADGGAPRCFAAARRLHGSDPIHRHATHIARSALAVNARRAAPAWTRRPDPAQNAAVTPPRRNPLRSKKNPFSLDLKLPPPGPARLGVIAMMIVGGLVAVLVPIVFAIMLLAMLRGE
jgi:hypothetical protein